MISNSQPKGGRDSLCHLINCKTAQQSIAFSLLTDVLESKKRLQVARANAIVISSVNHLDTVSYTHLTLPTKA